MPNTGIKGFQGNLNGLTISGFLKRIMATPKQTKVNAVSVPILTSSAASSRGRKPASVAVIKPQRTIKNMGVRVLG